MVVQKSRHVVINLFPETTCDDLFAPDFAELQLRLPGRPQLVAWKRPLGIGPVASRESIEINASCIHGEWTVNFTVNGP
jgi:hypothetical protein